MCKFTDRTSVPGRIAQSDTCLTADTCMTSDPGVMSLITTQSNTFVEFDHEIISTAVLLSSADSRKVVSVTSESMCIEYWFTALSSLPVKKAWLGELTVPT